MSTPGRHRAPKARKTRLSRVPAIALAATVALTGVVAVVGHASNATSQTQSVTSAANLQSQTLHKAHTAVAAHTAKQSPKISIANAKAQSKAAAKARAHAKAVRAFKARTHIKAVAAFKARKAAAKAKSRARIRAAANTKASVSAYVSNRSRSTSTVATRSRTISRLRGQVASLKSQLRKPESIGKNAVAVADNYRGVPYRRGGTSPRGFDCSGYTQYVYSKLGVALPRVASAQAHSAVPVRRSYAKPGDLVFYHSGGGYVYHVGIYAGGGQVWHAPFPGRAVEKVRISTHNVTFGRVSKSAAQNALAIKLAKKTAKLARLIHNK
jgi:cell wall-associated NlpC family hydrolase